MYLVAGKSTFPALLRLHVAAVGRLHLKNLLHFFQIKLLVTLKLGVLADGSCFLFFQVTV